MVQHRASLRQRIRTWWDEKSVHPFVLPIVGVVLSVLLLIGLALTVPPIIKEIIESNEPDQTAETPSASPSPEQTIPPVLQVPESTPSPQEPEQVAELPPAGPEPQTIPEPFVPQPQPVPVQPVPQAPLPPVLPAPPVQPVPSLPEVLEPVVPPILGPVLERPLNTVDEILGGTLDTVDKTVNGVTGIVGGLLP